VGVNVKNTTNGNGASSSLPTIAAFDDASIPRAKMPQVDEKDIPELLVFLGNRGLSIKAGFIDPHEVKAHQAVNIAIVKAMEAHTLAKPVLLSSDKAIIDGDHRWYRHILDNAMMPFIQIGCMFEDALMHIKAFPKTYELGDGVKHPISD
jgi:hypothetical protein